MDIPYKLLLALLLGLFIGLEREIHQRNEQKAHKNPILGLRTFSLVTVLGAIAGISLSVNPLLFQVISAAIIILTTVYYIFDSIFTKDYGITTEIAIMFSYIIGALIALEVFSVQLIVAVTVVLVLLLSRKEHVELYAKKIDRSELSSFISYGVIALVILPILPNRYFSLNDIPAIGLLLSQNSAIAKLANVELVNPFQLWFYVALITGIDVLGYILERTIGREKGWLLASLTGGFVSSTATTQSIAIQSKREKRVYHLISAAVLANTASFFQFVVLLAPLNTALLAKLSPAILAVILSGSLISIYFLKRMKEQKSKKTTHNVSAKKRQLFSLSSALKFIAIFMIVSIFSRISLALFGEGGVVATSALGSIVGMDAILINLAQLTTSSISYDIALHAFILANGVNLAIKSVYSFLVGSRNFAVNFAISMAIIIASSFIGLLFA